MGDVIQAGAALQLFRDAHVDIQITWVVDHAFAELAQSFKVADRVIPINSDGFLKGSFISRLHNLWKTMRLVRSAGSFDRIYTAHPDWRFRLLGLLAKAKKRISPGSLSGDQGFVVDRNRTFEYYRLLTGQKSGALSIDQALTTIGANTLSGISQKTRKQFSLPDVYIVLIPGGAKNSMRDDPLRRWPINNYVDLAKKLIGQGYAVILLGGPSDLWVSKYFDGLKLITLVGKTDLLDMVSILSQAQAVVAHDSGPIHLVSLTSAPLVAIFGPTPASAVISFARSMTHILQSDNQISCSPCYDGKNYAKCHDPICMKSHSVEYVYELTRELYHG